MNREIARYRTAIARRLAQSPRDIIQVDFQSYLRQIRIERRAGAKRRGKTGHGPATNPAGLVNPL